MFIILIVISYIFVVPGYLAYKVPVLGIVEVSLNNYNKFVICRSKGSFNDWMSVLEAISRDTDITNSYIQIVKTLNATYTVLIRDGVSIHLCRSNFLLKSTYSPLSVNITLVKLNRIYVGSLVPDALWFALIDGIDYTGTPIVVEVLVKVFSTRFTRYALYSMFAYATLTAMLGVILADSRDEGEKCHSKLKQLLKHIEYTVLVPAYLIYAVAYTLMVLALTIGDSVLYATASEITFLVSIALLILAVAGLLLVVARDPRQGIEWNNFILTMLLVVFTAYLVLLLFFEFTRLQYYLGSFLSGFSEAYEANPAKFILTLLTMFAPVLLKVSLERRINIRPEMVLQAYYLTSALFLVALILYSLPAQNPNAALSQLAIAVTVLLIAGMVAYLEVGRSETLSQQQPEHVLNIVIISLTISILFFVTTYFLGVSSSLLHSLRYAAALVAVLFIQLYPVLFLAILSGGRR